MDVDGLDTPARTEGINSVAGLETPDTIELRKQVHLDDAAAAAAEGKALYQVLV